MSNRLTFEFAVRVRKSTIREFRASRRELLVHLAHKTYEPAREKAEERGETMIHSAEKRAIHKSGRAWRLNTSCHARIAAGLSPNRKLVRLGRSVTISRHLGRKSSTGEMRVYRFLFGSLICRLLNTRERTYFSESGSMKT
jgi:hypothetical protein